MTRLLLTFLCGLVLVSARAQTCTQRLNQAEDDYEAGRLLGIPDQLRDCLASAAFSKEEEIRAKKLLTLVFIFTDQEAQAELSLIQLLRAEPEHRLNPQVDPAELFFLYNQYRTAPIFRTAIRAGVNSSYPQVIQAYGVQNTGEGGTPPFYNGRTADGKKSYEYQAPTDTASQEFSPVSGMGIGFWGELMVERHFKNGFEVGFGGQIRLSTYNVDSYINQLELNTTLKHSQTYLRSPLLVRYTFKYENRDRKALPYLFAGASFDYLLAAGYTTATRVGGTSFTETSSDMIATNQVNRTNYSYFGGVGVKLRMKTHFLTFEARYDNSRSNYINGEERYTNQTSTFDLGYVESDLSLNFISFSVGYTRSIYSPKKLEK